MVRAVKAKAGFAAASTAGDAAVVPAIVAGPDPVYAPAAAHATVLVAASVIVTTVLAPLVTAWVARRVVPHPLVPEPLP